VLIFLRRASLLAVALAVAACSSPTPSPGASAAASVTACQQAAPARLPAAGGQQPGDIRWSAALARCVVQPGQSWAGDGLQAPVAWTAPAPGGRLAVIADGVVSVYRTAAGARLWQRRVATAGRPAVIRALEVSSSLLMVQFSQGGATLSTFLNLSSGQPLGRMNVALPGDPFLVGTHVVLSDQGSTLEGYDPATGKTRWQAAVPGAPDAQAEVNDGTVVYLNSADVSSAPTPMRRIDRLDAATGRMLAPITLPRPLNFDLSVEGGNDFDQGLLLLGISSPATRTVAVDPAAGTVAWSYPGDVVSGPGLFTYFDQGGSDLTALDPATGRKVWSLRRPGLGTDGGPESLLATPGFAAAWSAAPGGRWAVTGIRPDGRRAWTSPRFPQAMFLANDTSTVYVIGCTPWKDAATRLCSDITLTAVAA
jgi:outer membrane protein assembly factor BamB